jgi:hypothetical protein
MKKFLVILAAALMMSSMPVFAKAPVPPAGDIPPVAIQPFCILSPRL